MQVRLGPDDKKRLVLMKSEEAAIIDVAAVGDEVVQNPHIVRFSLGNLDERRDRASPKEKGMESDGRLGAAENSPGKKTKTQVDGGRIESIDRVFEFESQVFAGIKSASLSDEDLGKAGIDAPIAREVGMSQGVAEDAPPKSHEAKPILHGSKAGLEMCELERFFISTLGHY